MKKATFTVNGVENTFTEVMGVFNGNEIEAILIHDERDTYHDGDWIISEVEVPFPETDEDAEFILGCDNMTCCFKVENGKYIVND